LFCKLFPPPVLRRRGEPKDIYVSSYTVDLISEFSCSDNIRDGNPLLFLERRRNLDMATSTAKILAKEEKMLTAVAESVGSTLGSIAARVNRVTNSAKELLPKPKTRKRALKRARKTLRKTTKIAKRATANARRKISAGARKAARRGRKVRRSMAR
jgi:hypothetical protein